jgi:hypothetical protein
VSISTAAPALGKRRNTRTAYGLISIQARPSVAYMPGSAVGHRAGVQIGETPLSSAPRADLVMLGEVVGNGLFTASATADAGGGAVDSDGVPEMITVRPGILGGFSTGTGVNEVTADDVDAPCFAYDDDTVYLTDLGGTLSFAGFVDGIGADGKIFVRMSFTERSLYALISAGQSTAGLTDSIGARAVVTALPVCTVSGGVLTVTATNSGATYDGVTGAVRDIVVIPEGTTNLPAAADAGPYRITQLHASGVKLILSRPAGWAHGDTISQHARISVSGEGTLYKNSIWKSTSTAALVVGTDAPALYPDSVTQAATLVAGTFTVSNVPILSATKSDISFTRTTPNTVTLTANGYDPSTITPGVLGTASLVYQAKVAAGTINVADVSTGNVTIRNF